MTKRIVIVQMSGGNTAVIDASRVQAVVPHYMDEGYSTVLLEDAETVKVKGDPVTVAKNLFGFEEGKNDE